MIALSYFQYNAINRGVRVRLNQRDMQNEVYPADDFETLNCFAASCNLCNNRHSYSKTGWLWPYFANANNCICDFPIPVIHNVP
jgi:hypothetical protein